MRIFVIEDDDHYRKAIKAYIEMLGHEVVDAHDPSGCPVYGELDEQCAHRDPCGDLLLIDQNMPKMTGLEFIRRQGERGCKGMAKCKALMSAALSNEELAQAEALGCRVFRKPFRLHHLRDWIEEVSAARSRERRLHRFS